MSVINELGQIRRLVAHCRGRFSAQILPLLCRLSVLAAAKMPPNEAIVCRMSGLHAKTICG